MTPLWFTIAGEVQRGQLDIPFLDVRFVRRRETFASSIPNFEQAWL
jgi:hypothetical protein